MYVKASHFFTHWLKHNRVSNRYPRCFFFKDNLSFLVQSLVVLAVWKYENLSTFNVIVMGVVIIFTLSMSVVIFTSYKIVRNSETF